MEKVLTSAQNQKLKGIAQRLEATLTLGKAGMSEGFLRTVNEALGREELVKVRFAEFKADKKALAPQLAERTSSHLVTLIGNVAVLYRQHPEVERRKIVV